MSQELSVSPAQSSQPTRSIMRAMSERFGMETVAFERMLMETVMPKSTSKEAVAAFLVVAHEYGLNPFTREIFAFEGQGGGVRPMVPFDGWVKLVNKNPASDGFELVDIFDDSGAFIAVESRFYRKDRSHPCVVREYLCECSRNTDPWKRWPRRMLRHKAFIQGARLAFGFSGIEDEDEVERFHEATRGTATARTVEVARIDMTKAKAGVASDPPGGLPVGTTASRAESEPPASSEAPIPPEVWYGGIRIAITKPMAEWADVVNQHPSGKGPFDGLTLRQVAASTDPKIMQARAAILETGRAQQESSGIVSESIQRLAEACRVQALSEMAAEHQADAEAYGEVA